MPHSPSPPEFFIDRSLGARDVADALRDAGWVIRTHREVFGGRDEAVEDVEWLTLCGSEQWPVLTMDRRIRYRPAELAAIRRFRVKAFVLASGNLAAAEQAERLIRHRQRIEAVCEDPGPFLYTVHKMRITRVRLA